MSTEHDNRVLNRRGARELTATEVNQITGSGGALFTLLSVIITGSPNNFDEHLDT